MVMLTVEAKIDSENSSRNTRTTVNSAGSHVLDSGDSSDKEHEKELNAAQSILLEEPTCIEESRLDGKTKENKIISTPAATVNNSKETAIESSKPEGVQSICLNSTRMIGEDHFKGISKPPIKHVYTRSKKQQVTEAINKSSLNKLDKGMGPESSNATRNWVSEMECKRELNIEEMTLTGVRKMSEEVGTCKEKEDNSVTLAAITINSKEKKISEDSSKTETAQLVPTHMKDIVALMLGSAFEGVSMDHTGPGRVRFHVKQYASRIDTRVPQNFEDNVTYESFSEMGLHENLLKGIYQYGLKTPSMVLRRGIVPLCKGLSVIHQSLFGTTVTLCCGVLHQLDYASEECQALILVPTYNLAQETKKIYTIIQYLPTKIQVGLFSTTFSNEALETSRRFMDKPATIIVPRGEELKDIMQYCLKVDNEEKKLSEIYALFEDCRGQKVIMFVNTKDKVMLLTEEVGKHYTVSASHDDMDQHARDIAIEKFESGSSTILIATDLRGTNAV
ncbi:hypothetical protein C2845_PM11G01300 [Panicum miliaceum]|uniref:ATP-dependent RNA helicase n=1 Tax=Panicum miliaceum TaxID=4540 RepID=A0A3L6RT13_PANMI|nr:hypothetical protein C2845_PM11G01300 [Panicum miliaceum]